MQSVKVYRREGNGYGRPLPLSPHSGDVLTSPLLPGLKIPLAAMFAE